MQEEASPFPKRTKEGSFLSKSFVKEQNNSLKPFVEKTIYRTQKFPEPFFDKDNDNDSINSDLNLNRGRLSQTGGLNRAKMNNSRRSINSNVTSCPNCKFSLDNRADSAKFNNKNKHHRHNNDITWDNLGEKIEDWFEYAKTPEQKIVYRFLSNIKDEDRDLESAFSNNSIAVAEKAQSLEDILDNLKKYRSKFSKTAKPALPNLGTDNSKSNPQNMNRLFESSTWRVMRHLKSADIRNKYPLPKANPDYHFRNATIYQTVGRPPKSTFLLHPDWV